MTTETEPTFLNAIEASAILGVTKQAVRDMVKRGALEGGLVDEGGWRQYQIPTESVEKRLAEVGYGYKSGRAKASGEKPDAPLTADSIRDIMIDVVAPLKATLDDLEEEVQILKNLDSAPAGGPVEQVQPQMAAEPMELTADHVIASIATTLLNEPGHWSQGHEAVAVYPEDPERVYPVEVDHEDVVAYSLSGIIKRWELHLPPGIMQDVRERIVRAIIEWQNEHRSEVASLYTLKVFNDSVESTDLMMVLDMAKRNGGA